MGRLTKQEKSFVENELSAMGPGSPEDKPGTKGYSDGK